MRVGLLADHQERGLRGVEDGVINVKKGQALFHVFWAGVCLVSWAGPSDRGGQALAAGNGAASSSRSRFALRAPQRADNHSGLETLSAALTAGLEEKPLSQGESLPGRTGSLKEVEKRLGLTFAPSVYQRYPEDQYEAIFRESPAATASPREIGFLVIRSKENGQEQRFLAKRPNRPEEIPAAQYASDQGMGPWVLHASAQAIIEEELPPGYELASRGLLLSLKETVPFGRQLADLFFKMDTQGRYLYLSKIPQTHLYLLNSEREQSRIALVDWSNAFVGSAARMESSRLKALEQLAFAVKSYLRKPKHNVLAWKNFEVRLGELETTEDRPYTAPGRGLLEKLRRRLIVEESNPDERASWAEFFRVVDLQHASGQVQVVVKERKRVRSARGDGIKEEEEESTEVTIQGKRSIRLRVLHEEGFLVDSDVAQAIARDLFERGYLGEKIKSPWSRVVGLLRFYLKVHEVDPRAIQWILRVLTPARPLENVVSSPVEIQDLVWRTLKNKHVPESGRLSKGFVQFLLSRETQSVSIRTAILPMMRNREYGNILEVYLEGNPEVKIKEYVLKEPHSWSEPRRSRVASERDLGPQVVFARSRGEDKDKPAVIVEDFLPPERNIGQIDPREFDNEQARGLLAEDLALKIYTMIDPRIETVLHAFDNRSAHIFVLGEEDGYRFLMIDWALSGKLDHWSWGEGSRGIAKHLADIFRGLYDDFEKFGPPFWKEFQTHLVGIAQGQGVWEKEIRLGFEWMMDDLVDGRARGILFSPKIRSPDFLTRVFDDVSRIWHLDLTEDQVKRVVDALVEVIQDPRDSLQPRRTRAKETLQSLLAYSGNSNYKSARRYLSSLGFSAGLEEPLKGEAAPAPLTWALPQKVIPVADSGWDILGLQLERDNSITLVHGSGTVDTIDEEGKGIEGGAIFPTQLGWGAFALGPGRLFARWYQGKVGLWKLTAFSSKPAQPLYFDLSSGKSSSEDERAFALSPDGKTLAYVGENHEIHWVSASREIGVLRGHVGKVQFLTFSPDGKLLASANTSGELIVWDMEQKQILRHFKNREFLFAQSLAFSPDSRSLATVSYGRTPGGVVRVIPDVRATGVLIREFVMEDKGVLRALYSRQGELLVASPHAVYALNPADGKILFTLAAKNKDPLMLSLHPEKDLLATLEVEGRLLFWNLEEIRRFAQIKARVKSPEEEPALRSSLALLRDVRKGDPVQLDQRLDAATTLHELGFLVPAELSELYGKLLSMGSRQAAVLAAYLVRIGAMSVEDLRREMEQWIAWDEAARATNGEDHLIALELHTAVSNDETGRRLQRLLELAMRVPGNLQYGRLRVKTIFEDGGLEIQTLPSYSYEIQARIWELWEEVTDAEGLELSLTPSGRSDAWLHVNFNGRLKGDLTQAFLYRAVAAQAEFAKPWQLSLRPEIPEKGYYHPWDIRDPSSSRLSYDYRTELTIMIHAATSPAPNPWLSYLNRQGLRDYRRDLLREVDAVVSAYRRRDQQPERWLREIADLPQGNLHESATLRHLRASYAAEKISGPQRFYDQRVLNAEAMDGREALARLKADFEAKGFGLEWEESFETDPALGRPLQRLLTNPDPADRLLAERQWSWGAELQVENQRARLIAPPAGPTPHETYRDFVDRYLRPRVEGRSGFVSILFQRDGVYGVSSTGWPHLIERLFMPDGLGEFFSDRGGNFALALMLPQRDHDHWWDDVKLLLDPRNLRQIAADGNWGSPDRPVQPRFGERTLELSGYVAKTIREPGTDRKIPASYIVTAAGLEEANLAGRVFLVFDGTLGWAMTKQLTPSGAEVFVVAETPAIARELISWEISPHHIVGVLRSHVGEEDYVGPEDYWRVDLEIRRFASGNLSKEEKDNDRWKGEFAKGMQEGMGRPIIPIFNAGQMSDSLSALGVPGPTIQQILNQRAGMEEALGGEA